MDNLVPIDSFNVIFTNPRLICHLFIFLSWSTQGGGVWEKRSYLYLKCNQHIDFLVQIDPRPDYEFDGYFTINKNLLWRTGAHRTKPNMFDS